MSSQKSKEVASSPWQEEQWGSKGMENNTYLLTHMPWSRDTNRQGMREQNHNKANEQN